MCMHNCVFSRLSGMSWEDGEGALPVCTDVLADLVGATSPIFLKGHLVDDETLLDDGPAVNACGISAGGIIVNFLAPAILARRASGHFVLV